MAETDEIRYFSFAGLESEAVVQAVFQRQGGVSTAPFASLNFSVSVGDAPADVEENRRRAFRALGRDPASIADLWQIHSADVVRADAPWPARPAPQADAVITDRPEVTLFLRFADCVPVLLYDPRRPAVGLVHAGWRGTLKKAVAAAVQAMTAAYGSRPADIWAGIGPSIGPCHYAVGAEVVEQTRAVFGAGAEQLLTERGQWHLDLWQANALALRQAGVEKVEISGHCTACRTDTYFSHRGEHGRTGRFGALMALRQ